MSSEPARGICEGCDLSDICHLIESPCNGHGLLWNEEEQP